MSLPINAALNTTNWLPGFAPAVETAAAKSSNGAFEPFDTMSFNTRQEIVSTPEPDQVITSATLKFENREALGNFFSKMPITVAPVDKKAEAMQTAAILVDEDVITPDTLRAMAAAASKIKLESSIAKKDWAKMAENLEATDTLNADDLASIRTFAKDVRSYHTQLHQEFRNADYSTTAKLEFNNRTISSQLEDVHVFMHQFEEPSKRYAETAAKVALQAVAPAGFSPLNTVAAYVAWAGHNRDSMAALVSEIDALDKGQSTTVFKGNKVDHIHGEEVWEAKMKLLDGALKDAKAGHPVEIDAQYFELTSDEFVGKLAQLAKAGCKVRINIDPSRPSPGEEHSIDDGPRKLRTLLQLSHLDGADVGVSMYPVARNLKGLTQLMHRKLLRVGETVFMGGMNANSSSGENVDAGMLIQGPAARQLVQFFARDAVESGQATATDIYGDEKLTAFLGKEVTMSPNGMMALLDCVKGPGAPGQLLPDAPSYQELQNAAQKAGTDLSKLVAGGKKLPKIIDETTSTHTPLTLRREGKRLFNHMVSHVLDQIHDPTNQAHLADVTLPEGKPVGTTTVALGDDPAEREALLLDTIAKEDKFIYIPTFVMTRPVARALIARRDELKAQGKDLDVRVLVDSGKYGFGSTPNEAGVLELEDAGIPVRWSLLPRSTASHDRKIHAKEVLTSHCELCGSTNLSKKALQDNWELSGVAYYDEADPSSVAERDTARTRFDKMWQNEAFELDTRKVADRRVPQLGQKDREMRVQESRSSAIRSLLNRIKQFETESAGFLQDYSHDLMVAPRVRDHELAGMAPGYALLMGVEEGLGTEAFYTKLHDLPGYKKLEQFRNGEIDWAREKA